MFNSLSSSSPNPLGLRRILKNNERIPEYLRDLSRYHSISLLAGMMTSESYRHAQIRLETLVHLALLYCGEFGRKDARSISKILNDSTFREDPGRLEDPAEEVLVSNITSALGNSRIYTGIIEGADHFLQDIVRLFELGPANEKYPDTLRAIYGLLQISDLVVQRSGKSRYFYSGIPYPETISIDPNQTEHLSNIVTVSEEDLRERGFAFGDIEPFVFPKEKIRQLLSEGLGHTILERYPLVRFGRKLIIALPAAVSLAIRRCIIEVIRDGGDLKNFQGDHFKLQFKTVLKNCRYGWGVKKGSLPHVDLERGFGEAIVEFDYGSYAHVFFLHDEIDAALWDSVIGMHHVGAPVERRIHRAQKSISKASNFRRGFTLLIHGGIGRGFSFSSETKGSTLPIYGMGIHDFRTFALVDDFSMEAFWKIANMELQLKEMGIDIITPISLVPLVAYAINEQFRVIPENTPLGSNIGLTLPSDSLLETRGRVKSVRDLHAVPLWDRSGWVDVMRLSGAAFFRSDLKKPIYINEESLTSGDLVGVIEIRGAVLWIACDLRGYKQDVRGAFARLWEALLYRSYDIFKLFVSNVEALSETIYVITLVFPKEPSWTPSSMLDDESDPNIDSMIEGNEIRMRFSSRNMAAFAQPANVAERQVAITALGGLLRINGSHDKLSELEKWLGKLFGNKHARHFHAFRITNPSQLIYGTLSEGLPRFISPADSFLLQWRMALLAKERGQIGSWQGNRAKEICAEFTQDIWHEIRKRLRDLDKRSLLARAAKNLFAIQQDRQRWKISSSALKELHPPSDEVAAEATERERERSRGAIAARVIIEMGVCECPETNGEECGDVEYDELAAHVARLVEIGNIRDLFQYGFDKAEMRISPDGEITVGGQSPLETAKEFTTRLGEANFERSTQLYEYYYQHGKKGDSGDYNFPKEFELSFKAEFGCSPLQLGELFGSLVEDALGQASSIMIEKWETLVGRLQQIGDLDDDNIATCISRLTLPCRNAWDQEEVDGVKGRDWYPWRFSRRLSVLNRPLLQLSSSKKGSYLVSISIFDQMIKYSLEALHGNVPQTMFESAEMKQWIGHISDLEGHEFNRATRKKCQEVGWEVFPDDLKMTDLRAPEKLGDIDVLTWNSQKRRIYIVECKRLLGARNASEMAEMLSEYSKTTVRKGKKNVSTPLGKHLERYRYCQSHRPELSKTIGVDVSEWQVAMLLVTDKLLPIHFHPEALAGFQSIVTLESLPALLG